ncbi:hypothetical protein P691DRAFT_756577 [Macrolepiota fuliginosa MF-IS2]|uniref:Uncharacterized protein n=1 Tax=Macrolepiota fuliginosa MF-IS2 TaxID=1400762 RepID=A0A9P5XK93_9AGAR|nr:hypothetical protein P691DRAFT_756577 [Macrolepiota fuliginosa MF-IS2]
MALDVALLCPRCAATWNGPITRVYSTADTRAGTPYSGGKTRYAANDHKPLSVPYKPVETAAILKTATDYLDVPFSWPEQLNEDKCHFPDYESHLRKLVWLPGYVPLPRSYFSLEAIITSLIPPLDISNAAISVPEYRTFLGIGRLRLGATDGF